jgi:DNA-directed RNA polymerase subunit beta'
VTIGFPVGALVQVRDGQDVAPGEVLARIPIEGAEARDITGGLPRVAELFEARSPKDKGVLAEMHRYRLVRRGNQGQDSPADHRPRRRKVWEELVPEGEEHPGARRPGGQQGRESMVDGPADPQDILRLLGSEELARYIVDEVQDVYRLQGVKINDKHIEVIVRQMLRRVVVENAGRLQLHQR